MARSKQGKKQKKLLGSHQRCWVWGRRLVVEILGAGRWPMSELHLDETLPKKDLDAARAEAEKQGADVKIESAQRLYQLCHTTEHQGYLAKMLDYPYAAASAILDAGVGASSGPPALYAVLDAIQDPFNLGAIARSAETLGVEALFIGARRQVEVTSMAARSSAGAVTRLPISRVDDLVALASEMRRRGLRLVAASEKASIDCSQYDFRRPTAIVLGNEGSGISPELLELCDAQVRIPLHGVIGSLNVAAAAAILFYEAARQRVDIYRTR